MIKLIDINKCSLQDLGVEVFDSDGEFRGIKDILKDTEEAIKKIMDSKAKPPLGVEPKYIWDYRRIQYLSHAMLRYFKEDRAVPKEWCKELRELCAQNDISFSDLLYLSAKDSL